jgi:predicted flap endonuclease-1-like 5' DNA nuclease
MNWIEQNWVLVLLGVIVVLVALWWLVGSGKRVEADKPATPLEKREEVSPVVTGPAVAPIDVPPPVEVEPLKPEPEALVEPIHPVPAGPADELTRMKGVGPKVAALLNGLGVTRFDQIAAWNDADVARVDSQLGAFKGRIARDQWVEQARLLAAGDTAGYEAKFGKLG